MGKSKVVIELDMEAGTMAVSINGKAVEDVDCVTCEAYPSYDNKDEMQVSCRVHCTVNDEEMGVRTMTTHIVAHSEEGKKAELAGAVASKLAPDFIVVPSMTKVQNDILKFISRK